MVVRGNLLPDSPEIPGYTDNISVLCSIVGRYLEHSQHLHLRNRRIETEIYISSADFMTRNTLRRVEVSVPIFNSKLREELR